MSKIAWITQEIVYIICTECLGLQKILYPELRKFNGKLCTLYMLRTFGFDEKLNIPNYENSTGNCVHYICTEWLDLQKNWISRESKIQREIVYIKYVWNVWFCRKIEYPELRKFDGNLCTLYMYGMPGFAEKLNIHNCENSTTNFVHNICTKCLDLRKSWISKIAKIQ